jgi:general stress protein YciG
MPKNQKAESPTLEAAQPTVTGKSAQPLKSKRGFAALSPERQRDGGKAAHAQGKAHEFTPEKAREAGRKGGLAFAAKKAAAKTNAKTQE